MIEVVGIFKPQRIQLISLGCSKNRVDSEKLLRMLSDGGIEIIADQYDYSLSRPDAVIINTCGFIKSAKEESIDEILLAIEAKKKGYTKMVVVTGCLSERYKEELRLQLPEVDAFFGTYEWEKVASFITDVRKANRDNHPSKSERYQTSRILTTPRHYAYLKISEGCNRKCSYCAIPLIKGRYKSFPITSLVAEAKELARGGVKELILIAQDTTYYGIDLYKKRMLATLLRKLSEIKGIEWIRIHYSYPLAFPQDVITQINTNPKVCKYLDIPLQHCSTNVLKAMRRGIDYAKTQRVIDTLRSKIKGVALRTTLMVGHPGEGESEFRELLNFVERNRFEMLGAFTYSEEENTYDALNYEDSLSQREKNRRYKKLMSLQAKILREVNRQRIGTIERVIVDDVDNNFVYTRSQKESPEVDGVIRIPIILPNKSEEPPLLLKKLIGNFVEVRITGVDGYDLIADFV